MSINKRSSCLIPIFIVLLMLVGFYLVMILLYYAPYSIRPFLSKSIHESKENNIFIREWKIDDIMTYDASCQFPFEQAWEETLRVWSWDEKGNEILVIDSLRSKMIVLKMKNDKDIKSFKKFGKVGQWVMKDDKNSYYDFLNLEMINIQLTEKYRDSTKLPVTIYKLNNEDYWTDDVTPLFKFNLLRDD